MDAFSHQTHSQLTLRTPGVNATHSTGCCVRNCWKGSVTRHHRLQLHFYRVHPRRPSLHIFLLETTLHCNHHMPRGLPLPNEVSVATNQRIPLGTATAANTALWLHAYRVPTERSLASWVEADQRGVQSGQRLNRQSLGSLHDHIGLWCTTATPVTGKGLTQRQVEHQSFLDLLLLVSVPDSGRPVAGNGLLQHSMQQDPMLLWAHRRYLHR